MVIFHSYVKLPEGILCFIWVHSNKALDFFLEIHHECRSLPCLLNVLGSLIPYVAQSSNCAGHFLNNLVTELSKPPNHCCLMKLPSVCFFELHENHDITSFSPFSLGEKNHLYQFISAVLPNHLVIPQSSFAELGAGCASPGSPHNCRPKTDLTGRPNCRPRFLRPMKSFFFEGNLQEKQGSLCLKFLLVSSLDFSDHSWGDVSRFWGAS